DVATEDAFRFGHGWIGRQIARRIGQRQLERLNVEVIDGAVVIHVTQTPCLNKNWKTDADIVHFDVVVAVQRAGRDREQAIARSALRAGRGWIEEQAASGNRVTTKKRIGGEVVQVMDCGKLSAAE